jgi:8-oxo-dGTP diphosphatase
MKNIIDKLIQFFYFFAFRLMLTYWFFTRPQYHGAYVGLWHDDRLLLIRNSYKKDYTVPCGSLHRQETALTGALRELAEEVDIHLLPHQLNLAADFEIYHEYKHDRISFFEAYLDHMPSFQVDNREVIWAGFLLPSEVEQLNLAPAVAAYLSQKKSGSNFPEA